MKDVGRQLQQLQLRLLPYFHAAQKREIQLLLAFTMVVCLKHPLLKATRDRSNCLSHGDAWDSVLLDLLLSTKLEKKKSQSIKQISRPISSKYFCTHLTFLTYLNLWAHLC